MSYDDMLKVAATLDEEALNAALVNSTIDTHQPGKFFLPPPHSWYLKNCEPFMLRLQQFFLFLGN